MRGRHDREGLKPTEVVGKLLDFYQNAEAQPQRYFLIRGAHDGHLEAIEAVLERYNLAVIVQDESGSLRLVGTLEDGARRAWQVVKTEGRCGPLEVGRALGAPADAALHLLDDLSARRLVMRRDDGYVSLPQSV